MVAVSPTAPSNPEIGQLWFNTTTTALSIYNGNEWQPIGLTAQQVSTLTTLSGNVYTKAEVDAINTAQNNTIALKQDALVSGTNIKTVNGVNILGSGNATVSASMGTLSDLTNVTTASPVTGQVLSFNGTEWVNATPISGVTDHTLLSNIGTITHAQIEAELEWLNDNPPALESLPDMALTFPISNGQVLSYNSISGRWVNTTPTSGVTDHTLLNNIGTRTHAQLESDIAGKQDILVSATNIKTINGTTILGSGDITVGGSDATKLPLAGGTMTGAIAALRETVNVIANGPTAVVNMSAGVNTKTITEDCTFSASNVAPVGQVCSTILELTNGGSFTLAWGGLGNVHWAGAVTPIWTVGGKDLVGLYTRDGGATWNGLVLAKDIRND
jgi:hypothetical protein